MKGQLYGQLYSMIQAKQIGALGTVVEGDPEVCPTGAKFLADESGRQLISEINETIFSMVQGAVTEVIRDKKPRLVETVFEGVSLKIFLDLIFPQERLIILGGGHIAQSLVTIAELLNYEVTVVDERPAFAHTDRFPQGVQVLCQDFAKAIRELSFDRNTYVIIVTSGHRQDKTCLAEVLSRPQPAYTGMIGSKRKVSLLFQELIMEGYDQERLAGVHAPIGLDIGAQTPEEIALSIMAEVVMVKRYGFSRGLTMKLGGEKDGR